MPTAIPTTEPRLTARQLARLVWLRLWTRHLIRRMERASARVDRLGTEKAAGRLLHFARRLLACHAEAAEILRCEEPPEVVQLPAIFERRPNS